MLESNILDSCEKVYVTGEGDPIASPLYWDFLKNLDNLTTNKDLKVFLHTNGILLDEEHWMQLGNVADRVVEIGISVDAACESTYKTNRGASWKRLWRNIEFINGLQAAGKPIMLGMFFTVQDNNFREMVDFAKMAFDHRTTWLSYTALRNWGTYTEEDYKQRAVHIPGHPHHEEFKAVLGDPALRRPGIIMDSFNPANAKQYVTIRNKD
jgi:MoaA/NifB/PqqE/SkfB family radical SAM enzyme